jgi:hypothetical protein
LRKENTEKYENNFLHTFKFTAKGQRVKGAKIFFSLFP